MINGIELRELVVNALESNGYDAMIDPARKKFLLGILEGNYKIKASEWSATATKRLDIIQDTQNLIMEKSEGVLLKRIEEENEKLHEYIVMILVFVLLLVILITLFQDRQRESKVLEETLKNIEFQLDPIKKKELQNNLVGRK